MDQLHDDAPSLDSTHDTSSALASTDEARTADVAADAGAHLTPAEAVAQRPNVTVVEREGKRWYLIGTAHVSQDSVYEVREVIEALKPDTVAIELCNTRYQSMVDENRWEKLDIFQVIREGKTLMLLANLAIGAYQRRLGAQLGVKPGAEMVEAAKIANETGAEVYLADREIQVTLKRTWANVGFFKRAELLAAIVESMFGGGAEPSAEEIEKLKEKQNLDAMMEEFATHLPEVKGPLIDERDAFMISKLREAPGQTIVAVLGAGHVPGMVRRWDETIDREAINQLPPPSPVMRALKWVFPIAVLVSFIWGAYGQTGTSLEDLIWAWVLPNMIFAALGAIIAGAKLPSIIVAGVMSPITSLTPLIPVGVPVGFVEAWLRKPTVRDAERIPDDVQSVGGLYRNAFTRTLLVVLLSIIGSAMGAWFGIGAIAWLFGRATGSV